ncbi:MAG: heme A synthase, partial [Myxococcota bacterium]
LALAAALLAVQIVLGGLTVLHLLEQWTVIAHLVTGNLFCLVLLLIARALLGFAAPPRPAPPRVRKLVLIAVHLLFLQVILGGLVSSNYAGLACPDWPACDGGRWFPALGGLVGIHIAHRLGAYATVVVFLGLAWAAHREAVIGNLARAALSLALFQMLAGVMNVLMRLPVEVTALHSAIATLLVLVTTLLARASLKNGKNRGQTAIKIPGSDPLKLLGSDPGILVPEL